MSRWYWLLYWGACWVLGRYLVGPLRDWLWPTMPDDQFTTPCCEEPMITTAGPLVCFNPDNKVVQCHACGAVWEPR